MDMRDPLDYMIEKSLYTYRCDPWYRSPGAEHYEALKDCLGQLDYRDEIFIVSYAEGRSGRGGMDEGSPPSITIYRVRR